MSLKEKCRSVSGLLSDLRRARQQQSLADALNKRAAELDDVQIPFVAAMSSIQTLREHGIVGDSRLPDSTKATERVVGMRRQLADEPQDITKGQAFNLLCRAVIRLTEQCETLATESWKEHVKQTAPVADKSLLDQHRDSPRHADTVYQMEQLLREVKGLVKKPPPDADTLRGIERQWDELRGHLSKLPASDDPEVQAFLNAAISGDGAALDLLTASVRQWLEENDMFADFCVRRSK